MNEGWKCPVCGSGVAPGVERCPCVQLAEREPVYVPYPIYPSWPYPTYPEPGWPYPWFDTITTGDTVSATELVSIVQ